MEEHVVLVDEHNSVLGTTPKATVHTTDTPLHRGFSVFLFNEKKEFYVTRRSLSKKAFPGVWTNSFCGHPSLNESVQDAAKRRAKDELGIVSIDIIDTLPYRYRCTDHNGIVENEICPVMIATTILHPVLNSNEVEEAYWTSWNEFITDVRKHPEKYSLWSREESELVAERIKPLWNI